MNQLSVKLVSLSSASLVIWRQVLNQPVKMPFWEAKSEPVQALVKAGLINLEVEGEGTYVIFTADLQKDFLKYRFTANQKLFLAKLAEGPLPVEEYMQWAQANKVGDPTPFVDALKELYVIKFVWRTGGVVFTLR